MAHFRSFTQKVGAGFAVAVFLTALVGTIGTYALSRAADNGQAISTSTERVSDARQLKFAVEAKSSAVRAYLLTGEQRYLDQMTQQRAAITPVVERLRSSIESQDERNQLDIVVQAENDHQQALDRAVTLRQQGATSDAVVRVFDEQAQPRRVALEAAIGSFTGLADRMLESSKQEAAASAATTRMILIVLTVIAAALASVIAFMLTRALGRQVGAAVGRVQVSSAELEAAAGQQATGAREEATAMSEVTTTIQELLVTSRQISDSSQRVAEIAEETAGAARSGESTIEEANVSIGVVRRQVDLVVHHMLELGQKSQHIAAVLEIVSEHAEQTNILAINATIEATGAGESGRRFAVVADEIRKLADRVAVSAKEIRDLITDVRGAVNTTVMATETGSKAIDAGSRQFGDVAASFKHIQGLVSATTEAAREIELSTKQQTTAVEQVNVAATDVAQASRATEASSSRTRLTASQLAVLSKDLLQLIRAKAPV